MSSRKTYSIHSDFRKEIVAAFLTAPIAPPFVEFVYALTVPFAKRIVTRGDIRIGLPKTKGRFVLFEMGKPVSLRPLAFWLQVIILFFSCQYPPVTIPVEDKTESQSEFLAEDSVVPNKPIEEQFVLNKWLRSRSDQFIANIPNQIRSKYRGIDPRNGYHASRHWYSITKIEIKLLWKSMFKGNESQFFLYLPEVDRNTSIIREGKPHDTELLVGNTVNLIDPLIYDPNRDKRRLQFRQGTFRNIGRSPNISKLQIAENSETGCCYDQGYGRYGHSFSIAGKVAREFNKLPVRFGLIVYAFGAVSLWGGIFCGAIFKRLWPSVTGASICFIILGLAYLQVYGVISGEVT